MNNINRRIYTFRDTYVLHSIQGLKKNENGHTYGYNTYLQKKKKKKKELKRTVIYANTYMYNMFKRKINLKTMVMYVISFVCVCVIQFEPNNLGRVNSNKTL